MAEEHNPKPTHLQDHEKFWAFMVLLFAIVLLTLMVLFIPDPDSEKPADILAFTGRLRLVDLAVGGLIAIAGAAAQALFRISQADKDLAAAAKATAEKVPPVTGEAREELNNAGNSETETATSSDPLAGSASNSSDADIARFERENLR